MLLCCFCLNLQDDLGRMRQPLLLECEELSSSAVQSGPSSSHLTPGTPSVPESSLATSPVVIAQSSSDGATGDSMNTAAPSAPPSPQKADGKAEPQPGRPPSRWRRNLTIALVLMLVLAVVGGAVGAVLALRGSSSSSSPQRESAYHEGRAQPHAWEHWALGSAFLYFNMPAQRACIH